MRNPASNGPPASRPMGAGAQAADAFFTQRFDSEALPARDRYSFWREAVCGSVAGVEISRAREEPFHGAIRCRGASLGPGERAYFVDISSVPQTARHGPRQIARETDAWLNLVVARRGACSSSQAGLSVSLRPGDMILKDLTRPSEIRFDQPYRHLVLKVPRRRFAARLPHDRFWLGRPISARSPLGRVLLTEIASLSRALGAVDPAFVPALVDRAVDLVALVFAGDQRNFGGCGGTVRRVLVMRAIDYIDAHLGDPDLSGNTAADALGVSVNHLRHVLRSANLTATDYIRRRRLERCRDDLANPARHHERISEIALRWGFRDMPWFSRAFRREFGLSARDQRACGPARG